MKWNETLALVLAVFVLGCWIGYKVGFRNRPPLSAKDVLLVQLSMDVSNYNSLKDGKIGLVEDNLRIRIWGEIKAYDLYKRENPSFNSGNKDLESWVEKGRIIAQEEGR